LTGLRGLVLDITELKRTEERLEKEKQELNRIIDSSPIIIFYKDKDGKFIRVNEAFAKAQKIPKEEFLGKTVFDLYSAEIARGMANDDLEVLKSGRPRFGIIEQYESASGMRWVQTDKVPILDKNGVSTGLVGFAQDITERKKVDLSLKESEEKFRTLSEELPNMIFINKRGRIVYGNKKCEDITGYTKEELYSPNFNFLSLCAPEYVDAVSSSYSRHMKNEFVPSYDFVLLTKNNERVETIITTKLIDYEGEKAILGIVTDISELKKAEERLQESETKFKMYLENSPVAVFVVNTEGKYEYVNEAASKLLGYSAKELLGMSIPQIAFKDDHQALGSFATLKETGKILMEVRLKNNESKAVVVSLNAVKLPDGKLIAFCENITERKKAEETLTQIMDKLARINEKLGVVGSLTRHDVRNKLSTVTGYAYLLKKKHSDQADIIDGLGKMEQAVAESMKIFDFSRMYEQLGVEELTYINMEDMLNEALALFSGSLNVKIVNNLHELTLLADSFLRQLLFNLIDNSIKHGKKVTTIKVSYEKAYQENLNLIYEDDGIGISADNKLKLFKSGYSTGNSSGYGLFLIKKMMEVYGWTIQENGEPGKGAKFTITIPKLNKSGKENYQTV
jgi:PAS domain S-box-containing protein